MALVNTRFPASISNRIADPGINQSLYINAGAFTGGARSHEGETQKRWQTVKEFSLGPMCPIILKNRCGVAPQRNIAPFPRRSLESWKRQCTAAVCRAAALIAAPKNPSRAAGPPTRRHDVEWLTSLMFLRANGPTIDLARCKR